MRGKRESRGLLYSNGSGLDQNDSSKVFEKECNLKVQAKALPHRLVVGYRING